MRSTRLTRVTTLVLCLIAGRMTAIPVSLAAGQDIADTPEHLRRAASPEAVVDLLYARPFSLDEAFPYDWLVERPQLAAGHLLVLEVDPEVARPRQVEVPVLFAGDTPAQLVNTGFPSGRMVVVVPDWVELPSAALYFGSTELPERIDRPRGREESQAATERGVEPISVERWTAARAAGGDTLALADAEALLRAAADLIEAYAPGEENLVESYRAPLITD